MYLEIYIDTLFLINFGMNFLILWVVKGIIKKQTKWYKIILSSATGSIISCFIAIFPTINIIIKILLMYLITSSLMVLIAFHYENIKNIVKEVLMLFVVTFFIGGILNSLYYYTDLGFYFSELLNGRVYANRNIRFYVSIFILLLLILKFIIPYLLMNKEDTKNLFEVQLNMKKTIIKAVGLLDTGNALKDPFSGKPVIIANYTLVEKSLPDDLKNYIEAYYHIEKKDSKTKPNTPIECISQLKFIPFHSVGKKNGIMIGFVFDEIIIKKQTELKIHKDTIVAIYDGQLSTNDDYQIILHKELL